MVAQWTSKMLRMFGLGEGAEENVEIGWGQEEKEGEGNFNVCFIAIGFHAFTENILSIDLEGRSSHALPPVTIFLP